MLPMPIIHPAKATSCPHWPAEIQAPGSSISAKSTPKLAGLNRCLPRSRKMNFEAIAAMTAIGWIHQVDARKSNVTLNEVMIALRSERDGRRAMRSQTFWQHKPQAKVSAICAGWILKSRRYAPAASRIPRNRICASRGSARPARKGGAILRIQVLVCIRSKPFRALNGIALRACRKF